MLGQNCIITKVVESCIYCYYVRCATQLVQVGSMPWPQTGTVRTSYKGRSIKVMVACYVVWQGNMIYGRIGLWTSARCVGLVPYCSQDGYQAQVPQHPIDACRYNTIHVLDNINKPTNQTVGKTKINRLK